MILINPYSFAVVGGGGASPDTITGLSLWLDADNNGFTGSDDIPIDTWFDLSGLDQHFAQGTEANMPIYKTSIVGGKGVIRFDGSDDYMDAVIADMTDYTLLVVLTGTGTIQDQVLWLQNNSNTFSHSYGDSVFGHYNGTSTCSCGDIGNGTFHIHSFTSVDSGARKGYRDGVLAETETGGLASGAVTWRLGARGGPAEAFSGDVAELVVYDSVLSSADHNSVGNYLATKYGLSWTNL